jgi:hypothetical protein
MLFSGGFSFSNFLTDGFAVFLFAYSSGCSSPSLGTYFGVVTFPAGVKRSGC